MSTPAADRAAVALVVAAGFTLAACAARADEGPPAGGGVLRVTAEPARLVLGRDGGCDLRVAAPPDVEELVFAASAGHVEAISRLEGGGFAARYRPPPERVPQVAIVSAVARTARGLEDGWIAIPLSGQGDARVRAAPGSTVALRIGDRTFGPATAGADGMAAVRLIVPPGVREAHQGFRPIELPIPETSLLHVVQDRTAVAADRDEAVAVVAYVVAPHGAARSGDAPVFEASRGKVSVAAREPGAFHARWTLPPGSAGEERLSVRLPAARASRALVRVAVVPGAPATVAVAFDRAALVAGDPPVVVTARALDAAGNTVPATLDLSASGGDLGAVEQRGPGEVVARLSAGPALRTSEAVVTATAQALGIAASRILPLRAADPATARFRGRIAVLRCDGEMEAELRLAVADRFGNAVSAAPDVRAARGRVIEVVERAPGEYGVRYVGPRVEAPSTEKLVVEVGGVRAWAEPLLVAPGPALTLLAHAGVAVDARRRFTGATAGFAAEREADAAFALKRGFEIAWRLEADGLSARRGAALATILAGASARRALGAGAELGVTGSAGPLFAPGSTSLAARLGVAVVAARRRGSPFVELSLLGAAGGAPGAFVGASVSAGLRLDLENSRADHPDRR